MPQYEPYCKLPATLDAMTRTYLECAEWSGIDDADLAAFESADVQRWAEGTISRAKADVQRFLDSLSLDDVFAVNARQEQAGHDLWLTRNRHGAGFWGTPDWPKELGQRLTQAAHALGKCWVQCDVFSDTGNTRRFAGASDGARIAELSIY
jgi:hypothetical protein